jgi:formate transporter
VIPGLSWGNFFLKNLIPVTLGNVLGGVLFVALAYWFVHLKGVAKEPQC